MRLKNYVNDEWQAGAGDGTVLFSPVTGEKVARASADGIDIGQALDHARRVGRANLQRMTFRERAAMLGAMASTLTDNRERYYEISAANSGATKADAAFDVDGGIGTLKFYAKLGATLGDVNLLMEPGAARLGKDDNFRAAHVWTPLQGVAVHINAFNFPSWGLWEKAAVALLSGMPVLAKPATSTAWLSHAMVRDVLAADLLPAGALSLLCGSAHDLLDHVQPGDAVAFTGSADTAAELRANPAVQAAGVPFNVEADSLNAAILGPDATPGTAEFDALISQTRREMTLKAGQKCTAIRRIIVPGESLDSVQDALIAKLGKVVVGNPANDDVRMGPLVNKAQQQAAWDGLQKLGAEATTVFGGNRDMAPVDADAAQGSFFPITLLRCDDPLHADAIHNVEVFGPVATLMPYTTAEEAFRLAAMGGGSLVTSVFTGDTAFGVAATRAAGPWHGRLALISADAVQANPGHGVVMPQCVHGGPGRAGGGEELGGLRALRFYHQRTAIQATTAQLDALRAESAEFQVF